MDAEIVKNLLEQIERRGVKHGVIAKHIGVSQPHFSQMINGKRTMTYDRIYLVLDFLGLKWDDISAV